MNGRSSPSLVEGELHRDFQPRREEIDLHTTRKTTRLSRRCTFQPVKSPTGTFASSVLAHQQYVRRRFVWIRVQDESGVRALSININIDEKKGDMVEIRNFLGRKRPRKCKMLPSVKAERSATWRINRVDRRRHRQCFQELRVDPRFVLGEEKDIRKFLDGMYVSEKRVMKPEDE